MRRGQFLDLEGGTIHIADCQPQDFSAWGKPAAVSVIIAPQRAEDHVLLIVRPSTMAEHAGQIACPGGRYDADLDGNLCETAIRETQEEVGVVLSPSRLIAILNPVHIPITGYTIAPHVFCLEEMPTLVPSPEVVASHWVPIDQLRDCEEMMAGLPQYPLSWGRVWGATARILHQLLHSRESEGKI